MLGSGSQIRAYDNLDDRREIHQLLRRLPPRRRLTYLRWVCQQATMPKADGGGHPSPSRPTVELGLRAENDTGADERFALEVYYDVVSLMANFNVPMERVLRRLVAMVREWR